MFKMPGSGSFLWSKTVFGHPSFQLLPFEGIPFLWIQTNGRSQGSAVKTRILVNSAYFVACHAIQKIPYRLHFTSPGSLQILDGPNLLIYLSKHLSTDCNRLQTSHTSIEHHIYPIQLSYIPKVSPRHSNRSYSDQRNVSRLHTMEDTPQPSTANSFQSR